MPLKDHLIINIASTQTPNTIPKPNIQGFFAISWRSFKLPYKKATKLALFYKQTALGAYMPI